MDAEAQAGGPGGLVPEALELDFPNVSSWLEFGRRRWPDRIALWHKAGAGAEFAAWTYARLAGESRSAGRMLLASGLRKGDRVLLWSENRPESCAVFLGALVAGLVAVPVDPALPREEFLEIARESRPKAAFFSKKLIDAIAGFREACPEAAVVAVFPEGSAPYASGGMPPEGSRGYLDLMLRMWAADLPVSAEIAPGATACHFHGPTRADPLNASSVSHRGVLARASAAIRLLGVHESDVFVNGLRYSGGFSISTALMAPLSLGAGVVLAEPDSVDSMMDACRLLGGSVMAAEPGLFRAFAQALRARMASLPPPARQAALSLLGLSSGIRRIFGSEGAGRILFRAFRASAGLSGLDRLALGPDPIDPGTEAFFKDAGFRIVRAAEAKKADPLNPRRAAADTSHRAY
jgi:long-chain acyl-CoA synthetase